MQPEISHRCASCGASIREPAMFCPDCGKPLAGATPEPEPQVVAEAKAPKVANVTAQDPSKNPDGTPKLDIKVIETVIKEEKTEPKKFRLAITPPAFDDMGQLLRTLGEGYKFTDIKAVVYFDVKKRYNWRINTSASSASAFRYLAKTLQGPSPGGPSPGGGTGQPPPG